jgi:hypothetical protein
MTDRDHPKFGARWDDEDDAVLREHYATRGACWCAGRMPWRTAAAVCSRAQKLQCAPNKAMRAVMLRERREANAEACEGRASIWAPPGPRHASVWAMAQGVTV